MILKRYDVINTKVHKRFALFPTRDSYKNIFWLETYWVIYDDDSSSLFRGRKADFPTRLDFFRTIIGKIGEEK